MEYITVKKASEKWSVIPRRVNYYCAYCAGGRIPGAVKMATIRLIPKDAEKPVDKRYKNVRKLVHERIVKMNGYKIMIVDDEPDILDLLEKALNSEGFFNITKVDNGLTAVDACKQISPDIIILDVMLPGIDGYEVCKRIRQFSHCPILFLSSKNDEVDRILGLAVGGDDYVTKPFSPKEVAFRVKAQLRRAEYRQTPAHPHVITVGKLVIDPDGCRASKNGKDMELTAKEFEILHLMAQNIGRVISRERLYESIWKEDSFGCDNTIMVHIRHLREKLEDNPTRPQYIITMKGLGYKLVNPDEK